MARKSDAEPTTATEFEHALTELVTDAAGNGVAVAGSWPIVLENGSGWDVEVVAVRDVDGTRVPVGEE
jgi:hypothetical protein